MSADPNALHRSVALVANLECLEEEYLAEDTPVGNAHTADLLSQ
jgi:hypothetical protein